MANKFGKKILTAFIAAGMTFGLGSCDRVDETESQYNKIAEIENMFEFDADYKMDVKRLHRDLVMVATTRNDEHFLNFKFMGYSKTTGLYGEQYEVIYKVNESYYNLFKDNFTKGGYINGLGDIVSDVEMIQELVDTFDPYKIVSHVEGEQDYISEDLTF